VSGCRMMSDNALWTRISGGISSTCDGLSRVMLGWVGVKIGVKAEVKSAASSTRRCRQRS
jgi:hypothetical protein